MMLQKNRMRKLDEYPEFNQPLAVHEPNLIYKSETPSAKDSGSPYERPLVDDMKKNIAVAGSGYKPYTPYGGSKYDGIAEELLDAARNSSFEDYTKGDAYKALVERYGANGERAMKDTLGQIAARTGGLASSYAGNVAQQSYNDYMAELEAVARGEYDKDRQRKLDDASYAMKLADRDYSRWQDAEAMKRSDNAAIEELYKMIANEGNTSAGDKTATPTVSEKDAARDQIHMMLANGKAFSDISPDIIRKSGYTTDDLSEWQAYYKAFGKKVAGTAGKVSDPAKKESYVDPANIDETSPDTFAQYRAALDQLEAEQGIEAAAGKIDADVATGSLSLDDYAKLYDEYKEKVKQYEGEQSENNASTKTGNEFTDAGKTNPDSGGETNYKDIVSSLDFMKSNGATKKEIGDAIREAYQSGWLRFDQFTELLRIYTY